MYKNNLVYPVSSQVVEVEKNEKNIANLTAGLHGVSEKSSSGSALRHYVWIVPKSQTNTGLSAKNNSTNLLSVKNEPGPSGVILNNLVKRKIPKTTAERSREYRLRKKLRSLSAKYSNIQIRNTNSINRLEIVDSEGNIARAKTSTERSRECRLRKRLANEESTRKSDPLAFSVTGLPEKKTAKTTTERVREYRQRRRQLWTEIARRELDGNMMDYAVNNRGKGPREEVPLPMWTFSKLHMKNLALHVDCSQRNQSGSAEGSGDVLPPDVIEEPHFVDVESGVVVKTEPPEAAQELEETLTEERLPATAPDSDLNISHHSQSSSADYLLPPDKQPRTDETSDSDLNFFKSVLPDVKALNRSQKNRFRVGVINLLDDLLSNDKEQENRTGHK